MSFKLKAVFVTILFVIVPLAAGANSVEGTRSILQSMIESIEQVLGQITGGQDAAVSNWDGTRPGYLEPVIDPDTGHTVIRITDAGNSMSGPNADSSLDGQSWGSEAGHGYSSRVAWNADQTVMMMEKGVNGETFIDGETYEPLFRMNMSGGTRWHPTDPDTLYWISSSCLGANSVSTQGKVWEECFSDYSSMNWSDPGKAVPSIDGKIMPVLAKRDSDGHWVAFYYYPETRTKSKDIDLMDYVVGGNPEYVASPTGDTIIIVGCIPGHESSSCNAQLALDFETENELWRETEYHHPGHADELLEPNGDQWRIGTSKESGSLRGHIIKRNFRTGEIVDLIPEWGNHTSTRNIFDETGKVVVTYGTGNATYSDLIVATCLDGSCPNDPEAIVNTHSSSDGIYLAEPHGSISPYGDKIVFRSNMKNSSGPIDAYVVEMSNVPLPDPTPDPDPAPPEPEPDPEPVPPEPDPTPEPNPVPPFTYFWANDLQRGMTHPDVLHLQKALNTDSRTALAAKGKKKEGSLGFEIEDFGPSTEKAVKAFQCLHGIVCEGSPKSTGFGRVGAITRAMLNGLFN